MLLLLRAQSGSVNIATSPASQDSTSSPRSIVYLILELLCCVLVDSPEHARSFEKLSGLESVMRVLKGSGVTKDVRSV